ncbi:MAG: tetratricopeptide repeat protein [Anaerolineae bacterium]
MASGQSAQDRRRRQAIALNNEAAEYLREGKPEKALPVLYRAVELSPDDTSILLNLGGAYVLLGRHEEAVVVLERAASLAPGEPMVWCNLGAALLRLPGERTDADRLRAVDALCRALELDPEAANVAYNLGLIHRDRGEWAAAAHYFGLALQANPDDRDARSLLQKMEAKLAADTSDGDESDGGDGTEGPLG